MVAAQLATGAEEFALVLSAEMAAEAGKHVELYTHKGLLVEVQGVAGLAAWMAGATGVKHATSSPKLEEQLRASLQAYNAAAVGGSDPFGKQFFTNAPISLDGVMYAGRITPVLHYCMGGVTMDEHGHVLRADGSLIRGLHAAGEVTGGVHGENRLGGNSLLECTVFGSIVGNKLAKEVAVRRAPATDSAPRMRMTSAKPSQRGGEDTAPPKSSLRTITQQELSAHAKPGDYWVALYGKVYDLSSFVDEHPAGPESITKLAGSDGTTMYQTVHNLQMLSDFENDIVGAFE